MLPNGDETMIGEKGVNLSGGQKSRVALARATYQDADILLLDDPLSAVDAKVGAGLMRNCLQRYLRKKTRILVTHQLQYLQQCDYVVVLQKGEILDKGTFEEVVGRGLVDFSHALDQGKGKDRARSSSSASERTSSFDGTRSTSVDENKKDSKDGDSKDGDNTKDSTTSSTQNVDSTTSSPQNVLSVGREHYYAYIHHMGGWSVFFGIFFLFLLTAAARLLSDWWVSVWVGGELDAQGFTPAMYMIIYGCFFLAVALITALRGFLYQSFCLLAAKRLHDSIFLKMLHASMDFFYTTNSGTTLNKFSADLDQVSKKSEA